VSRNIKLPYDDAQLCDIILHRSRTPFALYRSVGWLIRAVRPPWPASPRPFEGEPDQLTLELPDRRLEIRPFRGDGNPEFEDRSRSPTLGDPPPFHTESNPARVTAVPVARRAHRSIKLRSSRTFPRHSCAVIAARASVDMDISRFPYFPQ